MNIRILDSARRDLNEGFAFYESQAQGLGDYFLSSMRTEIEGLRISAGIHRISHQDYHRLLCRRFPFVVFYLKESDEVPFMRFWIVGEIPCGFVGISSINAVLLIHSFIHPAWLVYPL